MVKHSGDRESIPANNTNKQTTSRIKQRTGTEASGVQTKQIKTIHSQHPFKHRADIFVWFREAINIIKVLNLEHCHNLWWPKWLKWKFCNIEVMWNAIYMQYILSISFSVLNSMHCMHLIQYILLYLYFIICFYSNTLYSMNCDHSLNMHCILYNFILCKTEFFHFGVLNWNYRSIELLIENFMGKAQYF
jgi:hypothetical protein